MNFGFLKSNAAKLLTLLLIAPAALLMSYARPESIPPAKPLSEFPVTIGPWQRTQDGVMEKEVLDMLQADDILNRNYALADRSAGLNFFVAAFRSQRTGKTPHSPKNCLPGSGWVEESSSTVYLNLEGLKKPLETNRYVVAKGGAKSLVYYWYQSRDRSVANEYRARVFVVADAIRYNRTDTALVRVVAGINGNQVDAADQAVKDFIAKSNPVLRDYLPQ